MARTSTRTCVAAGSTSVIDAGKLLGAMGKLDTLILVPTTLNAILSSCSVGGLFLDVKEEVLMPFGCGNLYGVDRTVCLDPSVITTNNNYTKSYYELAAMATATICLDALINNQEKEKENEKWNMLIAIATTNAHEIIFGDGGSDNAIAAVLHSAQLLKYGGGGGGDNFRSASVKIASPYLPLYFPKSNLVEVSAALLPFVADAALRAGGGGGEF